MSKDDEIRRQGRLAFVRALERLVKSMHKQEHTLLKGTQTSQDPLFFFVEGEASSEDTLADRRLEKRKELLRQIYRGKGLLIKDGDELALYELITQLLEGVTDDLQRSTQSIVHLRKQLAKAHDELERQAMTVALLRQQIRLLENQRVTSQTGVKEQVQMEPSPTQAAISPAQVVAEPKRSIYDEVILIIGGEGINRSTRIKELVVERRGMSEGSVSNALKRMLDQDAAERLIRCYEERGKEVQVRTGRAGPRPRLLVLEQKGVERYRELTGQEPVAGEIAWAYERGGQSLNHGLGIIRLAEVLEAMGHSVKREPGRFFLSEADAHLPPEQRLRVEPDLLVDGIPLEYEMDGKAKREDLEKWRKLARLFRRVYLVAPNRDKQRALRREVERCFAQRAKEAGGELETIFSFSNLKDLEEGLWLWEDMHIGGS